MKKMFMDRPLWQKLMLLFLLVGTVPMLVVSYQSLTLSKVALTDKVSASLTGLRDAKAKAIQDYFANRRREISFLASAPQVVRAAKRMKENFKTVAADNGADANSLARYKAGVDDYYRNQFGAEYEKRTSKSVDMQQPLSLLSNDALALQYFYISNNANPLGQKHLLDAAKDQSAYSREHDGLHTFLRSALLAFGYYDVFLIDPDTGDVFYTCFKELDFASNLSHGAWKDTGLGDVFRGALSLKSAGDTFLVDFARYRPSYEDPASFMAAPIYDQGKIVAIVAIQMPLEPMNAIMNDRSGLGETGETYLVGNDYLMRSDSLRYPQTHTVKASFTHPDTGTAKSLSTQLALKGERGTQSETDYGGKAVISAFAPLDLGDVKWAIVGAQDQAEALAPTVKIEYMNGIIGFVSALLIALVAWLLGRLLSSPIVALRNLIVKVEKTADLDQPQTNEYADEIGQTGRAFASLLRTLKQSFADVGATLDNVALGHFEAIQAERYSGDIKRLADGVNATVEQLKAGQIRQQEQQHQIELSAQAMTVKAHEAELLARQAADEAERANKVKQALDVCNTAVMMADENNNIVYMNNAVSALMRRFEGDLKSILPHFRSDQLIGKNMDVFHRSPSHQQRIVSQLTQSYSNEVKVAGKTLKISLNPITIDGKRVGTVTEWVDRTEEVSIEQAIDQVIAAASSGDFSAQIDLQGKQGFFLTLSKGLNEIVSTTRIALEDVMRVMSDMAQGNLDTLIDKDYAGLFGQLKNDVNTTLDRLNEVVGEILESSESISNGASEIEAGIVDLSRRTEQQAASLEETASSMDEMTASVKNSAQNASSALSLTKQAEDNARAGGEVVQRAIAAMSGINQSSKKIVDIIGVIDEIAFQTNLLALNAAVEAARAGEQGRGFSVVASEVRKLAQRSADAAREIKGLIKDSVVNVENGSSLVNDSGRKLFEIIGAVERVASTTKEIAAASHEQAQGITQVNIAVSQMDESTQQNSALVEQATAAAESMAMHARNMVKTVEFFKTRRSF